MDAVRAIIDKLSMLEQAGHAFPSADSETQHAIGECSMQCIKALMREVDRTRFPRVTDEVRRIRRNFKNTNYQKLTRKRKREEPVLSMVPPMVALTERMLSNVTVSRPLCAHSILLAKQPMKIVFTKKRRGTKKSADSSSAQALE